LILQPSTGFARTSAGAPGEKVSFQDPAAAPLGTDDEAAGTPASREARQLEASARPVPVAQAPTSLGPAAFYFGVVALLALAIVVGAYLIA
jgi:hypothetical protein